jgi:hypothetical protein
MDPQKRVTVPSKKDIIGPSQAGLPLTDHLFSNVDRILHIFGAACFE